MPLISANTIDKVFEAASIEEVVGKFVDLKKNKACCPFHGEETPSFTVTPRKNIYKCFGCGVSGGPVKFVMEHEKLSYPDAIKWLADFYNIAIEFDQKEENQAAIEELEQMKLINKAALRNYYDKLLDLPVNHPAINELLTKRGYDLETIIEWQLGWAPDEWKFLTPKIIDKGLFQPALALGIVQTKNGNNWDFFKSRIIIPIHDLKGNVIGFGGRHIELKNEEDKETKDKKEKAPKYLNSSASKLYNKDRILFGLDRAAKAIKEAGKAILAEGYFDVISLHKKGVDYSVGPCGTAFTPSQAKLLKKYTNHVILMGDGDGAGKRSMLKSINILLKEGFKVEVFPLPEGEDPDSFARKFEGEEDLPKEIEHNVVNAIIYKASILFNLENKEAAEKMDEDQRAEAFGELCEMLSCIQDDFKKEEFVTRISKLCNIRTTLINSQIKQIYEEQKIEEEKKRDSNDFKLKLPAGVDKEDALMHGFYEMVNGPKTGYYFFGANNIQEHKSNFIIKPLFHIYSKDLAENRRIVEIDNGQPMGKKVIEMPNKAMLTLDKFEEVVYAEGFYVLHNMNKVQLQKIKNKYGNMFPLCYELKTLGWQPEGFFAFYNCLYNGNIISFSEYGIASHKETNYFSPAASSIYKLLRKEDDEFVNDKYLAYNPSPIDFNTWCALMDKVYGENGRIGIVCVIVALFRDIIFKLNNNCPLFYGYGQIASGKSTWADSISNVFFKKMKAFNLNQGTDFAFFQRIARFRNCVVVFNEFDEDAIKDIWFRAFKAAFDGEGREKGSGKGRKTETQDINAVLLLIGQYLSTKDGAAVLSRVIPAVFEGKNERTPEEVENHRKLKDLEEQGLSGMLIELLQHRKTFDSKYYDAYGENHKRLKAAVRNQEVEIKERILNNYCVLLSCIDIFKDIFTFPFAYDDFFEYCKKEVIRFSKLITESDALAGFWKTVEFLLDDGLVIEGWDFRIETYTRIMIRTEEGKDIEKTFDKPTKLLLLRLNNIYNHYKKNLKSSGQNYLNDNTIRLYFKSQKGYIGSNGGTKFKNKEGKSTTTSSFVFDYDLLGVNLERLIEDDDSENLANQEVTGIIVRNAELIDRYGKIVIQFSIATKEEYMNEGFPVTKSYYTRCTCDNMANSMVQDLQGGKKVKVIGDLTIKKAKEEGKPDFRNMKVSSIEFIEEAGTAKEEELPF